MTEQQSEQTASPGESFRELLLRRGSEAALRVVSGRRSSGMGGGTIDSTLAIQYLRSKPIADDKIAQEIAKSDQPYLNAMITDPSHAVLVTSPETTLDEHQAAIMDFSDSSGVISIWRFPRNSSPQDIAQLMATEDPTQVERLEESMLASRAYRALERAASVYVED
ncbi:MAG: hypothetical protein ACHQUB_03675 [Candidatus Saccharimonadia bacterium]